MKQLERETAPPRLIIDRWFDVHGFGAFGGRFTPPFHTSFQAGFCDSYHSSCEQTLEKRGGFERLETLVQAEDWKGLGELMNKVHTVHFNAERNAIQVENCGHDIIASYQLPERTALASGEQ